jgi:hypothetical protein
VADVVIETARLINHEDPIRFSHIVSNQAVINLQHSWLIPQDVADLTLHRSHATGVGLQGNRLNGLAFERAELPHYVPKEMVSRLAPPKALPEGSMKGTEFVEEPLDLTGADIELRQCIDISWVRHVGSISRSPLAIYECKKNVNGSKHSVNA